MTREMQDPFDESLCEDEERLLSELEAARRISDERQERILQLTEDLERCQSRCESEKSEISEKANEKMITDLLVIMDELEKQIPLLTDLKRRDDLTSLAKNLLRILSGYGLRSMNCLGKRFDPKMHEALIVERCGEDEGIIIEEYQRGYLFKTRVIRPAKVKIITKI